MPENADENGDFRKQFLKVETFEIASFYNASFLVWTGENEDFWKRVFITLHF